MVERIEGPYIISMDKDLDDILGPAKFNVSRHENLTFIKSGPAFGYGVDKTTSKPCPAGTSAVSSKPDLPRPDEVSCKYPWLFLPCILVRLSIFATCAS